MKNKVTALLLATTMAISGTAGAFTVSAAEAADSGTLKLSVTTGDVPLLMIRFQHHGTTDFWQQT